MIHPYIPHTHKDREAMLAGAGFSSEEDMFRDIPEDVRLKELNLPSGLSEWEVQGRLERLARKNSAADHICFAGGGAYDHYVPALVDSVISRSEFYTAYTPYQPEISQGTLQYIFEYQSMIGELTGMDAVNASLYDGSTAAAEAMMMAVHATRRNRVVVSETVNPIVRKVMATYARFQGIELVTLPMEEGLTDWASMEGFATKETAALVVQSPNYFGLIEDTPKAAEIIHPVKGLFVQIADPLSLALLKTPAEAGADIAVGEAQSLGLSLNFGGPYLGFIGATKKLMRKLPGRICGQTVDKDGKRAFVLTLQAREQHIRREKATSNICSNQSLCSLAAAVYMAAMGKTGLVEAAEQSLRKAAYLAERLKASGKWDIPFAGPFFREFPVIAAGSTDPGAADALLREKGYLGGIAPEGEWANWDGSECRIVAVTEKRSRSEMDEFAALMTGGAQ